MKNIAVYAGTFDPITFGHIDVICRAANLFDQVVVGIAVNFNKKPLFSLDERIDLTKNALQNLHNVSVDGFNTLLINFAKLKKAQVILRGLRTVTDFDYEFQLGSMNRQMDPQIETLFLMPSEKYMYISSSLVREIAMLGGDVSNFVPEQIVAALKAKMVESNGVNYN